MSWNYIINKHIDLKKGLDPKDPFQQKLIIRGSEQERTATIILDRLKNYPGMVLGDEVGMGKTWIALLTAIPIAIKKPVLILTPSRLLSNQWKKQYLDLIEKKCDSVKQTEFLKELLCVNEDFSELIQIAKKQENGIYICAVGSVDPVGTKYRALDNVKGLFELLILDEGHNFKNESTQRYQIFKTTRDDKSFKEPLNKQSNRVLILTATPFQLGHEELRGVLSIIESTNAPSLLKIEFKNDLDQLLIVLDKYKNKLSKFEYDFKMLTPEEHAEFASSIKNDIINLNMIELNPPIRSLIEQFASLQSEKNEVNRLLLKILVRNIKDKKHRSENPNPLSLQQDRQLLFFITEQLGRVRRRHLPDQDGHMAAVESSYGRFQDHLNSMANNSNPLVMHYRNLADKLFSQFYVKEPHPKMDQIVDDVFRNWEKGEKSLIFCFYTKTVAEFSKKIEEKVKSRIEDVKNIAIQKHGHELIAFRNSIGIANHMSALVFRDNFFLVSIAPLLNENKIPILQVLNPTDKEIDNISVLLQDINFNPTAANFNKIISVLSHHACLKIQKKHNNLISKDLEDDFAYFLDPENFKELYRRQDSRKTDDETSLRTRRDLIKTYIQNLVTDQERLLEIMTHPTIWSGHRAGLEKLDIKTRIHITEIIGSYLTSDEYIYFDLLPNFTGRPVPSDIPEAYKKSKPLQGHSTYDRVTQFLQTANQMAAENLEKLADEIYSRYRTNKTNAEKVIVETVTGDVSSEGKIKTVTAFRTPFPPYILVSTSVLSEGVDLHTECRHVVHYDHEWNPAVLEQKTGRIDRVGSLADRLSVNIDIGYPYIRHTQDEKAHKVVMARKSWFNSIMGERYESKWSPEDLETDTIFPLPEEVSKALQMNLDNDTHEKFRCNKINK